MHLAPPARTQHGPCAARFLSSGREEQHLLLSPGCAKKSGLSRVRPCPQGCHPTSQGDPTVCPHPVSEPSREEKPPRHGWSWAGLQYPGLVLTPHRGHTWGRHARPVCLIHHWEAITVAALEARRAGPGLCGISAGPVSLTQAPESHAQAMTQVLAVSQQWLRCLALGLPFFPATENAALSS